MRSLSRNFLSADLLFMQMSCDLIVQMSLAVRAHHSPCAHDDLSAGRAFAV